MGLATGHLVVAVVIVILQLLTLAQGQTLFGGLCPDKCHCSLDERGRMEVLCEQGRLLEIPTIRMSPSTEVIRITPPANQPNHLAIGRFFKQFKKLEELHIVNSNIPNIGEHSFWGVQSLRVLNLTGNNISLIVDSNFKGLISLEVLDLSHNNIDSFVSASFSALVKLKTLNLSSNRATKLVERLFYNLHMLEVLDLSGNWLRELGPDVFRDIWRLKELRCRKCGLKTINPLLYALLPDLKVREVIYNQLTNLDLRSLRQVCRKISEEIDFMVGVPGILDDHCAGNLDWIRLVKLRSLSVINFQTQLTNNSVLAIPNSLKTLKVSRLHVLSPSNLKALLHGAKTVQRLMLNCGCTSTPFPELTEVLVVKYRELCDISLDAIRFNHHLNYFCFTICLPPGSSQAASNLLEIEPSGFKPTKEYPTGQQILDCQDYSRTFKAIAISTPFMNPKSLDQWKIVLDLQTRLEIVWCIMGNVHWSFYFTMLQNCYRTLRTIHLSDVQSLDPACPFDWSVLSECPSLEVLIIEFRIEPHIGFNENARFESINFSTVNMENLRELKLVLVRLDESEFEKIFNYAYAPKLEVVTLEFFRSPLGFYSIFSTLSQALKNNSTIQTVTLKETFDVIELDQNSILIWIEKFKNKLMWNTYKYQIFRYTFTDELSFAGMEIERLPKRKFIFF